MSKEQEKGGAERPQSNPVAARRPASSAEIREFQAETRQLLDLMIHSLYSTREIFLRELISNASDALDRYRFAALTDEALTERDDLEIRIEADPEARTLIIRDNGIGMSRQELVDNIGTIAHSGTKELLARLAEQGEGEQEAQSLIGQFGVGFYSAFMVAERVDLVTLRAGESQAICWSSDGDGTYSIEPAERAEHGTTVMLQLRPVRPGEPDFASEWTISSTVQRYSDFVRYPIKLLLAAPEAQPDSGIADEPEGERWRQLNSMKAIWTHREGEVSDAEYDDLYRHMTHDWEPPLLRVALHAEGRSEYHALLFVPARAPFDLFYQQSGGGLQLYVHNVKIMESCSQLLPAYLRFVKGVVDSPDLPLNVSREVLQHDSQLALLRRGIVKKLLGALDELLRGDRERYGSFWEHFGRVLKEGVISDPENKERLLPLLLFASSASEQPTTLSEYVERAPAEQEEIFYLTGETRALVEGSPHLESARARGYEVLYLTDPIDELMIQYLSDVGGKRLRSLSKGDVQLGDSQERAQAEQERRDKQAELAPMLSRLGELLDAHVKEVRLSHRLTHSPVCLVGEEQDETPRLRRLLRQSRHQVLGEGERRIMELNADHPLLAALQRRFMADSQDPLIADYADLLLGQGLLAEGSELPEPARFIELVAQLMVQGATRESTTRGSTTTGSGPLKKPAASEEAAG